jgi:hypothetical protein
MNGTKTQVKRSGKLGSCSICSSQTTTVLNYTGVPRQISPSGQLAVPYCDDHLPTTAKTIRDHEGAVN